MTHVACAGGTTILLEAVLQLHWSALLAVSVFFRMILSQSTGCPE